MGRIFKREYLGIPSGGHVSPFTFELYEQATQALALPQMCELLKPSIIAHDVGHAARIARPRSSAAGPHWLRISCSLSDFEELRQGLYGSARASELAAVDRRLGGHNLIVADLSNDATYAEILVRTLRSSV